MKLLQHRYGKARVRVLKVMRAGAVHSLKELDVSVLLQGDFAASYTRADNRLVVATDSIKNTVNVLAKKLLNAETEEFGSQLAEHFLKPIRMLVRRKSRYRNDAGKRISPGANRMIILSPKQAAAKPFAKIVSTRAEKKIRTEIQSGIEDLLILKSTGSGFENFLRDEFTTLPETGDRVFATKLKATWSYQKKPKSFSKTNEAILDALLEVFANTFSPSAQVTLFKMGEAALKTAKEISKIDIAMPNKHCLLINLKPFGMENKNELFVPTEEPHGQIEGTVAR